MRRVSRQLPVDPDDPTIQGRAQTSHSGPKCDLAGRAALGGKPTLSWTRTSQTGQRTKSLPSNPLRESKSREARNRSREDSDSAAAKIRHLNCRAVNLPWDRVGLARGRGMLRRTETSSRCKGLIGSPASEIQRAQSCIERD